MERHAFINESHFKDSRGIKSSYPADGMYRVPFRFCFVEDCLRFMKKVYLNIGEMGQGFLSAK